MRENDSSDDDLLPDNQRFTGTNKNVLLPPNLPANFGLALILKYAMHRFFTFPPNHNYTWSRLDLASSGFYLTENQCVQCYHCKLKIDKGLLKTSCNVDDKHKQLSPNCPLMNNEKSVDDIPITDTNNYRFESHRLFSLLNTEWKAPVTQYDLAKHGFYWTGSVDNCRCAFCRLEVRGWEPGDTAAGEHRKWNPNCPIARSVNSSLTVGNVPIGSETDCIDNNNSCFDFQKTSHGQIKYTPGARKVPVEILGVTPDHPPRRPKYISEGKRLDSFKMWPKCLPQKPEMLAEAGFYYIGVADRVICFQCGGGLMNWAENDTPWAEHAKWFSKCPFLLLKKGKTFVEDTLKDHEIEMLIQHGVEAINKAFNNSLNFKKNNRMCEEAFGGKEQEGVSNLPTGSLLCALCGVKDVETLCVPCGHATVCVDCVRKRDICPECNTRTLAQKWLHNSATSPRRSNDETLVSAPPGPLIDATITTKHETPKLHASFKNALCLQFAIHRFFTFFDIVNLKISKLDLAKSGFYCTASNSVQCNYCKLKISSISLIHSFDVDAKHKELSPDCPLMNNDENTGDVPITDTSYYHYEAHRLFNLLMNIDWTDEAYVLAKNGFYWAGPGYTLVCAFCKLEVDGEQHQGEHECRTDRRVSDLNRRTDVPVGCERTQRTLYTFLTRFSDDPFVNKTYSIDRVVYTEGMSCAETGIICAKEPFNPKMTLFDARLKTFEGRWTSNMDPVKLAKAGFYFWEYEGCTDLTLCHVCGGDLKSWDITQHEDALKEHALWFPKCTIVLLNKEDTSG